jgi:DegV family protein with EDD domain
VTVTVVTDSAAALPADVAASHGVRVVPLVLHVGDDRYRDGDIGLDELVARFDEPISTSAPAPGEFLAELEPATDRGPVLVLTVAARMSTTHQSAVIAARQLGDRVVVLDTGTAAGAQGLIALAAARAANDGGDLADVVAVARDVSRRVRLVATVDDLERLAKSGRVPDAARWIGDRLGVQPLFEFRDGSARPLRPAFSRAVALDRILQRAAGGADASGPLHVMVLHALDTDAADRLAARVAVLNPATCTIAPFSPVMVAHTGRGLAGLAWWREP